MRCLDLFAGIGGFPLAAQWMGWETVAWCEWNPFCQTVLKHHFPEATGHGDITKTDFTSYAGTIDILTGGFPCQPYSTAGKRKGKDDERHLWPEMLRAIKEVRPRWIVGENVLGLVNWSGGLVFHEVQSDLEAAGYEVWPYVLPACSVNAPHRRDRVWLIAYRNDRRGPEHELQTRRNMPKKRVKESGVTSNCSDAGTESVRPGGENAVHGCELTANSANIRLPFTGGTRTGRTGFKDNDSSRTTPDTERLGQPGPGRTRQPSDTEAYRNWKASWTYNDGRWPTEQPVCAGDDGIPTGLADHSLSKSKWREQSIMGAGNAIVPQVALQIYKAIDQYEQL